jgi:hypothetical protein
LALAAPVGEGDPTVKRMTELLDGELPEAPAVTPNGGRTPAATGRHGHPSP